MMLVKKNNILFKTKKICFLKKYVISKHRFNIYYFQCGVHIHNLVNISRVGTMNPYNRLSAGVEKYSTNHHQSSSYIL